MKKFIKTTDEETATKLIALGFKVVSHIGNVYTFLNEQPKNMTFDSVDTGDSYAIPICEGFHGIYLLRVCDKTYKFAF